MSITDVSPMNKITEIRTQTLDLFSSLEILAKQFAELETLKATLNEQRIKLSQEREELERDKTLFYESCSDYLEYKLEVARLKELSVELNQQKSQLAKEREEFEKAKKPSSLFSLATLIGEDEINIDRIMSVGMM